MLETSALESDLSILITWDLKYFLRLHTISYILLQMNAHQGRMTKMALVKHAQKARFRIKLGRQTVRHVLQGHNQEKEHTSVDVSDKNNTNLCKPVGGGAFILNFLEIAILQRANENRLRKWKLANGFSVGKRGWENYLLLWFNIFYRLRWCCKFSESFLAKV